jgi:Tol biopolymer transport system component
MKRAFPVVLFAVTWCCQCSADEAYGLTLNGGPSRDGRFLSFADAATGNLVVREIATGVFRPLTTKPVRSTEFAYFSAISRDSSKVAYAWFNDEGFYDLRVVNIDGSQSRVLYRNEQAGFVQPCAWSSDGKQILTLFFRKDNISQIALVPLDGGPPKILRSLNWVYPKRMDLSPDDQFVVYDSFANADSGDRTVFLLAVNGAKETKLIERSGNHLFPLWTPDGRSIVFVSDQDVMQLPIANGRAAGEPKLLFSGAGRILPMGITHDGTYYYGIRSGAVDVFVTDFVNSAANAKRVTLHFPGRNIAPSWSRDGTSIAYLSRRGTENFGQESRTIVLRSFGPDEEKELPVKLAHIERVRWSPDGHSLLVSGSDAKGRGGLYSVDVQSGALKSVVVEPGASFRGFEGVWSPDGKSLYYLHGDSELRSLDANMFTGASLRNLAISPDGRYLAVCDREDVVIVGVDGSKPRRVPMPDVHELEWGPRLVAGKGADLWEIPVDGTAARKLESAGNRQPGFSLHPDGKRIAVTAGRLTSEVRVLKLGAK